MRKYGVISSATIVTTVSPSLRLMGRLCRAILLLLLAFDACSLADANASCSSAGGMSCRVLSQTSDDVDEAAALMASLGLNITIPAEIAAPSESRLLVALRAVGHQHYSYNGTAWVLYNATAWLYEGGTESQQQLGMGVLGTHFFLPQLDAGGGQPSWQLGTSRVTARTQAGATVDSDSITWSLLQATSCQFILSGDANSSSSSSSSSSSWVCDVTFVQRLDTQRGLPPPSSTASATATGATYSSVYAALYAFYTNSTSSAAPL